ncbi:MAG: permease-like cell division protein FtsX [Tannerella sp.]|jgi:cell division transport system permease protein|nr:permease-like cell division protein FtsX [Tannerella sp.]
MAGNKKVTTVSFFYSRFISIISITLALYMVGIFLIVGLLSSELSVYMKENLSFSIILKDDLREFDILMTQKKLELMPFIKSTQYISKEDVAKEITGELGEDPRVFLGYNPFNASIEVKLHSAYINPDSLQIVEQQLTSYDCISELVYQKEMMQTVNDNIKRIGFILLVLILILMTISFVLVSNTIRLIIYSKRFLIYTMRLVGATPDFIRRPFIRYNIISSFFAGVLAIILLIVTLYYLQQEMIELRQILPSEGLFVVYVLLLLTGILLSITAAFFAVNQYLRMERGKMYYI